MPNTKIDLRAFIRDVPDFPKPGILFRDITPLLGSRDALDATVARMAEPFRDDKIAKVVAIESRGFIFGSCVARELKCGFVPIRKPGKLPWTTVRNEYKLEYGSDALEIHHDAFRGGERVLLIDDVLATGGTAAAATALCEQLGAEVAAFVFLIELTALGGRARLNGVPVVSLLEM
ncbi:MAG TPA: adenine phosphoribosyltransferase [Thermoanaerobaculia bacterium]